MAKQEIADAVLELNRKNFLIYPMDDSEEEVVRLLFDDTLPDAYEVVKLDVANLPNNDITWVNYWGIKDAEGKWVGSVGHWAYFKDRRKKKTEFRYVDGAGGTKPGTPARAAQGMVRFHFDTGDPAAGWK